MISSVKNGCKRVSSMLTELEDSCSPLNISQCPQASSWLSAWDKFCLLLALTI